MNDGIIKFRDGMNLKNSYTTKDNALVKQKTTSSFFQAKLSINDPDDKYEREADTVAREVMRKDGPGMNSSALPVSSIQRQCAHCEENEKNLQRKEKNEEATSSHSFETFVGSLAGSGQPLSEGVRNFYEPRFGYNFGDVKIHADNNAAASAGSIHALAYTTGNHIVFNSGQYSPYTSSGKQLLAHELTHVVQQRGTHAKIQKAEDWDFTPADYKKLIKAKKKLAFGPDSAWVPKKLQDNILATIKFVLTSKKPVRTAGINVSDFYHGHLVVPHAAVTKQLKQKRKDVSDEKDLRESKALGKDFDVTSKTLKDFTQATIEMEKLSTPLVNDALSLKGAAVIYHTFEASGPEGLKAGDPTRNIKTDIGGSPAGYSPPDINSAAGYVKDYFHVLQFAFLVDENGIIHVTVGSTPNLSRVTGTPIAS